MSEKTSKTLMASWETESYESNCIPGSYSAVRIIVVLDTIVSSVSTLA